VDIFSDIQADIDRIESRLALIYWREFVASLPAVFISSRSIVKSLPRVSAVYFLHNYDGLLYIGKVENLKARWAASRNVEHECLDKALKIGGVRLSWKEMEIRHLVIVESAFIRLWYPVWNVVGKRIPRVVKEREKLERERKRAEERAKSFVFTPEEIEEMESEQRAREKGTDAWIQWTTEYHKAKEVIQ
jgi:hypothetical protein